MGRKYHKVIKKVVVQINIFFKTLILLGLKKDTLKVCSQKFVETIDNDKLICYNKAKLRGSKKERQKAEKRIQKIDRIRRKQMDQTKNITKTIFYVFKGA